MNWLLSRDQWTSARLWKPLHFPNRRFRDDGMTRFRDVFFGKLRFAQGDWINQSLQLASICRAALDFIKLQHILDFSITEDSATQLWLCCWQSVLCYWWLKRKPLKNTHTFMHCLRWRQNISAIWLVKFVCSHMIISEFVSTLFVLDRQHCGRDV